MTTTEFESFVSILCKLWPRLESQWNDEIAGTWRRVCDRHPPGACVAEIRGLAERLKFPARPNDLRDALERRARMDEAKSTVQARKEYPSQIDLYRQWLAAGGSHDRKTLEAMTDAEVNLEWERGLFASASRVYAPVIKGVDFRGVPVPDLDRDNVPVSLTLRVAWDRFQAAMATVEQQQGVTA